MAHLARAAGRSNATDCRRWWGEGTTQWRVRCQGLAAKLAGLAGRVSGGWKRPCALTPLMPNELVPATRRGPVWGNAAGSYRPGHRIKLPAGPGNQYQLLAFAGTSCSSRGAQALQLKLCRQSTRCQLTC